MDEYAMSEADLFCDSDDLIKVFRDETTAQALRGAAETLTVHWGGSEAIALVSAAVSVGVRGLRVELPWGVRSEERTAEIRFADMVRKGGRTKPLFLCAGQHTQLIVSLSASEQPSLHETRSHSIIIIPSQFCSQVLTAALFPSSSAAAAAAAASSSPSPLRSVHTSLRLPSLERACARACPRVSYGYGLDPSNYSKKHNKDIGLSPAAAAAIEKFSLLPLSADGSADIFPEAVWVAYSAAREKSRVTTLGKNNSKQGAESPDCPSLMHWSVLCR